jgi:hypothetical protein
VADRDALKMEKPKQSVKKGGYPPPLSPGAGEERSAGPSSRFRLGLSGKRGTFRFTTLAEAEHTLQRVANMIVERERSELEQAEIQEERDACKRRGDPTESWPQAQTKVTASCDAVLGACLADLGLQRVPQDRARSWSTGTEPAQSRRRQRALPERPK